MGNCFLLPFGPCLCPYFGVEGCYRHGRLPLSISSSLHHSICLESCRYWRTKTYFPKLPHSWCSGYWLDSLVRCMYAKPLKWIWGGCHLPLNPSTGKHDCDDFEFFWRSPVSLTISVCTERQLWGEASAAVSWFQVTVCDSGFWGQPTQTYSAGTESTSIAGDPSWIPGSGRSPGGGHGNPLEYSCLENPHGQRSLADGSPRGHKELDMTKWLSTAQHNPNIIS